MRSDRIPFDRSVGYYDRTRGFSEEALAGLVETLGVEMGGDRPCLDVGVGTGLLALPLHRAGHRMFGVDLSGPMVGELVRKAGGRLPFPVVLGDATHLPFRDGSFGTAVIRHLLHLIPQWRTCVSQIARVLGPGGVVLVSLSDYPEEWRGAQERFMAALGRTRSFVGWTPGDLGALDEAFVSHGGMARDLPHVQERGQQTLGDFIQQMEDGKHSWTWKLHSEERSRGSDAARRWALEAFGSLEPDSAQRWPLRWRAYDLPGG